MSTRRVMGIQVDHAGDQIEILTAGIFRNAGLLAGVNID